MSSLSSRSCLVPLALACCLPLTSCNLFHKDDANANGQYASTGNDGHYNPYPAGSKPSSYKYQQYNEAPPPPYSGSDDGESHSKKKTTTHKKSSGSSKSDSGSGSGSKSKSKSKSGTSKSGTTHSKSGSGSSSRYTVKSNDTLYGIAKKHHTTVSKIKNMNDLSSDKIHEGQKLKLP